MSSTRRKDLSTLYANLKELNDITKGLQIEMTNKSRVLSSSLSACKSCQMNVNKKYQK